MQILTSLWGNNVRFGFALILALLIMGVAGCGTPENGDVMKPPEPVSNPAKLPPLAVGDTVTVTLSDIPDPPLPEEKPIQGDGTISMPYLGRVDAAGKTPGDLEDYLKSLYVPKIYTHLSVTVKTTGDRVYFVRGEVHQPGRLIYVGPITVTKAITSAGDFTDPGLAACDGPLCSAVVERGFLECINGIDGVRLLFGGFECWGEPGVGASGRDRSAF